MQAAGIGGATIFNLASAVQESHAPTENNPWPAQTYRSPAYWDALKHAAAEAQRLGLKIGLHNTVGYSTTGGPWVTEARGMQKLVWSRTPAQGGRKLRLVLPEPEKPVYTGWGSTKQPATYYRDIVVLAVPQKPTLTLADVVNVSEKMDATGQLTWRAPVGTWTIYRIGHSPTMANPHPVPDELIGKVLEVDKMSAEQSRFHWNSVLEPVQAQLGPYLGRSFDHMLIDSYEAGDQTWTPEFRAAFLRRKGYDPLPWLVCLPSATFSKKDNSPLLVLVSPNQTARFLWDFRDVISQLYYDNGWTTGQQALHKAGLSLQFEPYGGPFDTLEGVALANLPMAEFWNGGTGTVKPEVPAAARAAGKTIVGAEALTGSPANSKWTEDPAFLKRTADGAFGAGINRLILHHWVHQPFDDAYQPGMGMGWWGTHFGRYQTWNEPGKAFFSYLGRCQALLQTGQQPADYLCVGKLEGFADALSVRNFLRDSLRVVNGRVMLPSGRAYAFVAVPGSGEMLVSVARKIGRLVAAGATVVSAPPTTSPGLAGFPACDDTLRSLARRVWSRRSAPGSGRVLATVAEAVQACHLTPDYLIEQATDAPTVKLAHRQAPGLDLYFVANQSTRQQKITLSFRISGRQPELWQAEDGSIADASVWHQVNDRTFVDIVLKGTQSVFVVFRRPAVATKHLVAVQVADTAASWTLHTSAAAHTLLRSRSAMPFLLTYATGKTGSVAAPLRPPLPLAGPWEVSFAPKLDKPFVLKWSALTDFSRHDNPDVKYFAGTATYSQLFSISKDALGKGQRLMLDLGVLNDLAQVSVNGRNFGVLWYPPYQVDVTDALRIGSNQVSIAVTNNWANRLIGDEQQPADFEWGADRGERGRALKAYPDWFINHTPRPSTGRKAFTVWYYYRSDSPLLPAGLVGPVRLIPYTETMLN